MSTGREIRFQPGNRPLYEVKAEMFKSIGHPARIRILEILSDGEHSVSELLSLMELESSHLSQQLGVLRRTGLVQTRKEGTTVVYALSNPLVIDLLAVARRLLREVITERAELLETLEAG